MSTVRLVFLKINTMSIFKGKKLIDKNFINKVVDLVNLSRDEEVKKRFSKTELRFINAVSKDMTEDEIEQLKTKIEEDESVMKNYQNRTMLKDSVTGKLLPKSSFAIDINYPARGFRAITTHS